MKKNNLFFLLLLLAFKGFSQFETPKRKVNIAPVSNSSGSISPTSSRAITYPSIFDKKDKLLQNVSLLNKKPEEEKSVMEKEQFASASKTYTDNMNRKSNDGAILERYKSDTYLGEFKVGTQIIKIACRDHEAPDGDVVRIWLNDKVAVDAILLDENFSEVFLELKEGINKIEVEAMNQGESGPNTAQFVIFDERGGMVTTNKWNLTTGVKAKLIILKTKDILEKQ
ncbi:hypothetical protein [Flavobacterium sp. XGLA_31]|uniref:hypothetical protein n=1 Tax=Flavobacterium sp. XGLA_31 TaxID=3447666 RepID=UPI003F3AD351